MAKKRKQKEEEREKPVFIPPEFDEREFMENEIKNSRISIFVFLYAILFACLSWVLTLFGEWYLAVFLGVIAIVTMANFLEKLNLDLSHLEKKDWLGNYAMFAFAWLGVWILLCNPPFSDIAPPDLERLTISTEFVNGTWRHGQSNVSYSLAYVTKALTPQWMDYREDNNKFISSNTSFNITMKVTDNTEVKTVDLWIHTSSQPDNIKNPDSRVALANWADDRWSVVLNYEPGDYFMFIFMEDIHGNSRIIKEDHQGNPLMFSIH